MHRLAPVRRISRVAQAPTNARRSVASSSSHKPPRRPLKRYVSLVAPATSHIARRSVACRSSHQPPRRTSKRRASPVPHHILHVARRMLHAASDISSFGVAPLLLLGWPPPPNHPLNVMPDSAAVVLPLSMQLFLQLSMTLEMQKYKVGWCAIPRAHWPSILIRPGYGGQGRSALPRLFHVHFGRTSSFCQDYGGQGLSALPCVFWMSYG